MSPRTLDPPRTTVYAPPAVVPRKDCTDDATVTPTPGDAPDVCPDGTDATATENAGAADGVVIPGIPYPLPRGEQLRWTGAPDQAGLARHAMHVRALAVYFALLVLVAATAPGSLQARLAAVATAAVWVVPLGVCTVVFARTLAALAARTTTYAITDHRVVMRVGVALPTTINIPFSAIESVDVLDRTDGSGDIAFMLGADVRVAYLLLWPHARPWHFIRPRPTFRAVRDVAAVATQLRAALGAPTVASAEAPRPRSDAAETARPAPAPRRAVSTASLGTSSR